LWLEAERAGKGLLIIQHVAAVTGRATPAFDGAPATHVIAEYALTGDTRVRISKVYLQTLTSAPMRPAWSSSH